MQNLGTQVGQFCSERLHFCCTNAAEEFPCQFPPGGENKRKLASDSLELDHSELTFTSLDFIRLMIETGKKVFRASGTCMVPALWPGDRLFITQKTVREAQAGEIAVFARNGKFFGHRIIEVGEDIQGSYIITRPDQTNSGDDGKTYDNSLLGIVQSIERHGKQMPAPEKLSMLRQSISLPGLLFLRFLAWIRNQAYAIAGTLSRKFFYAIGALCWFRIRKPGLAFEIRIPYETRIPSLNYQKITGEEIERFQVKDGAGSIHHWSLVVSLDNNQAASLSFSKISPEFPCGGWWLVKSEHRLRYQGIGLEQKLIEKAKEIFSHSQVSSFFLARAVFEQYSHKNGYLRSDILESSSCSYLKESRRINVEAMVGNYG